MKVTGLLASLAWREDRCREVPHGFGPDVRVWLVDVEGVGDVPSGALGHEVIARARRMRDPVEAGYFTASHAALRAILAAEVGRPVETIEVVPDGSGKPRLGCGTLRFNLSRSGPVALIGVSRGPEIGVDVERLAPVPDVEALAREHLSAREHEQWRALESASSDASFLRCWTRKEACVKAIGVGVALPLGQVDAGGIVQADRMQLQLAVDRQRWEVAVETLSVPGGWIAAAALATPVPE